MNHCEILKTSKTIAIVGISSNPIRTSRKISEYLIQFDYNVVGVNPGLPKIDGIDVYASLIEIPYEIDIVNVFRRPENILELIPDVLQINPKVLWLQLGIRNDEAVEPVIKRGITTIQNRCIKIEHGMCF